MKTKMMLLAMLCATYAGQANAQEYRVEMLNKAADGRVMAFEPAVIRAQPGDTVTFVAKDKGHNSALMKGGAPEGAETWKGKINEEVTVTLSKPGVYMYQCAPHVGMGMIGAIVVGEPANLEAVKGIKYPGKSKAAAEKIFAEIESGG
ncbi:pseudoazurin [Sinorhizobium meliloti]|uniref:pseudoazurin n=1 Tax=Rhizobium meliloti TaxID=382 RepID=UPI000D1D5A16|nr:pseudoazurin [Sinorhizobium meliloti]MDW9479604.1 pseudoazurin [Sinorhizobium meliloti]MDW9637834.1 pseudoazurin [Sinorhizobium meliloti]MDW9668359.1 pseudoazurin [Sinorhizobium meliloti]MDW9810795.1 pseudoazurin [Sinorhizobium meliloti]MDW9851803.1 pseudoazurin [Sinorhizobium meliloti]